LAHVQQFALASTTEATETLVGRADVEWHVMREDTVVEQATAKEITHEDVEVSLSGLLYPTVWNSLPQSYHLLAASNAASEPKVSVSFLASHFPHLFTEFIKIYSATFTENFVQIRVFF